MLSLQPPQVEVIFSPTFLLSVSMKVTILTHSFLVSCHQTIPKNPSLLQLTVHPRLLPFFKDFKSQFIVVFSNIFSVISQMSTPVTNNHAVPHLLLEWSGPHPPSPSAMDWIVSPPQIHMLKPYPLEPSWWD